LPRIATVLTAVLLAANAWAQDAPAAVETAEAELIAPQARDAVKRMIDTLTGAERMSYEYESSYDALQADGEMLEFGSRGKAVIRRPDRVRGEIWHRDGRHVVVAWNGKDVAFVDRTNAIFATTPRTGDIDSFVDFMRDDVGLRLPTADLFTNDLGPMLVENVVAARWIGKEQVEGVEVEHVALRLRTGIDVQLWIQTGPQAVPTRIVMNFATADGRPQFRAAFREWNLDPWARDGLFELAAPKDARRVEFIARPRRAAEETAR
jgi:hypothetical protein